MNNNRRTFLKKIGLGTIAASNIPGFASAESLLRSNNPEKLNFQLERTERSYNGEYRNEYLSKVAFPIGGIGAGMFCLEGTGAISHLSVNHRPEIYNTPYAFAAISIKGIKNGAKVLESTVPTWKLFVPRGSGNGLVNRNYGLPRFEKGSFISRFPFGIIDFTSFINTGTGFDTISLKNGKPRLEVFFGSIDVKKYNIFGKEINL